MSERVHVAFLASDLGKWDAAEGVPETLVLPFFADERPLRGAAGLCDWRLCGRLSRLLQVVARRRQAGARSRSIRRASGCRLQRLLMVGLGHGDRFDEKAAHEAARLIADRMRRLATPRYALVPPGPLDGAAVGTTGARDLPGGGRGRWRPMSSWSSRSPGRKRPPTWPASLRNRQGIRRSGVITPR